MKPEHEGIAVPDALWKARETEAANQALKEAIYNQRFSVVRYFLEQRIHKFRDVVAQTIKAGCLGMVKDLVGNINPLTRTRKGTLNVAAYQASIYDTTC